MDNKSLGILQVNTLDNAGGAAKIAMYLHLELMKRGYKSVLAVGKNESSVSNVYQIPRDQRLFRLELFLSQKIKQIPILRILTHTNSIGKPIKNINNFIGFEEFNFPGTSQLLNLISSCRPDILHFHNLHGGYFDLRMLPLFCKQAPTIITLHDAWLLSGYCPHSFDCTRWKIGCGRCPYLWKYSEIHHDATDINLKRKQKIISNSHIYVVTPCQWLMDKVKQSVLKQGIVDFRVIPNGVDLKVFHPYSQKKARKELELPLDYKVLLFAANGIRHSIHKDYSALKSTLTKVSSHGMKILCLALGEEAASEYLGEIEIRFVPYQTDAKKVARFFQAADLYIHPAYAETFPNTILEAMACGIPVISNSVGGIPEQIQNGITGFLIPRGNIQLMTEKIILILEDDLYRQEMSRNAAEDAVMRFGLDRMIDDYLHLYWEIQDKNQTEIDT